MSENEREPKSASYIKNAIAFGLVFFVVGFLLGTFAFHFFAPRNDPRDMYIFTDALWVGVLCIGPALGILGVIVGIGRAVLSGDEE